MKYRIKKVTHRKSAEYFIQQKKLFVWKLSRLPYGFKISCLAEAQDILKDRRFNTKIKYYYE